MAVTDAQARAWMEQWRAAGPALEAVWKAELRALTPERARLVVADLLALGDKLPLPPARLASSGLIDQQRFFKRR